MAARGKQAAPGRPRLTIRDARDAAARRGGECVSAEEECRGSKSVLRWRCAELHEWRAALTNVRNVGTWCPRCAKVGRPRLDPEEAYEEARAREGACLSAAADFADGAKSVLRWRCREGHEWAAAWNNVKNLRQWCPRCRASAPEKLCYDLFVAALGLPSPERRPRFLRTPDTPKGLELDIYYPQYGFAVEVQGLQHRQRVPHFHPREEDWAAQRARDAMKRELCEANWIVLLELREEEVSRRAVAELLRYLRL